MNKANDLLSLQQTNLPLRLLRFTWWLEARNSRIILHLIWFSDISLSFWGLRWRSRSGYTFGEGWRFNNNILRCLDFASNQIMIGVRQLCNDIPIKCFTNPLTTRLKLLYDKSDSFRWSTYLSKTLSSNTFIALSILFYTSAIFERRIISLDCFTFISWEWISPVATSNLFRVPL